MNSNCTPYAQNPQRRLRRLRRLFAVTREQYQEFAPLVPMGILHKPWWDGDEDVPQGCWQSFDERIHRGDILLQVELEWACKTAMESVGGKWE